MCSPRTFKLTLSYDGAGFAGWQLQADVRTVQGALEEALRKLEGARVVVTAAGRTDAGVHAVGQVVSFEMTRAFTPAVLARALNAMLPDDVRVMDVEEAPAGFSARRRARLKTYCYLIWNAGVAPPLVRQHFWLVPDELDVAAMNEAATLILGAHDFAAFQGAGGEVKTTRRTIVASTWTALGPADEPTGLIPSPRATGRSHALRYEISGNGFLRHMVRVLVGTFVAVGRRRLPPDAVVRIVASGDRMQAGPTAPPHGLVLWKVDY